MKIWLTWTERRPLQLFLKLWARQNLHFKAEMFGFLSEYFVYRKIKKGAGKIEFSF